MKKIAVKIIYSGASIFFSKLAALCATFYLVRALDGEQFGRYSYIYATILVFQSIASMSLGATATKQISTGLIEQDKWNIFGVLVINFATAFLFSVLYLYLIKINFFGFNIYDKVEIYLSVLILFFGAISPVFKGIVVGGKKINSLAKINAVTTLIYIPVLFFGVNLFGYNGALLALTVYYAVDFLFSALIAHSIVGFNNIGFFKIINKNSYKVVYNFGVPTALSGIIVLFLPWMALKAVNQGVGGVEQVGLFSVANQWRMLLLLIPAVTDLIMVPILNEMAAKKINNIKNIIVSNFFVSSGLGLVVLMTVLLFSEEILGLYGESYVKSSDSFILMMIAGYLYVINSVVGQFISSVGNMWHGLLINLAWGCVFGFGIFYHVNDFNTLAQCYVYSYAIHGIIQVFYFIKNKYIYGF